MPSENRQCQCGRNMGGQLIPDPRCRGRKRFWSGHSVAPIGGGGWGGPSPPPQDSKKKFCYLFHRFNVQYMYRHVKLYYISVHELLSIGGADTELLARQRKKKFLPRQKKICPPQEICELAPLWPLMFFWMVPIWLWKRRTGVIVEVCILEEFEQGTKAVGGAVPWKQLWQFWNQFDGERVASAGRPGLAWCGSTETFVQQLEPGCSEPSEGEQGLMRMCLQEENCNSQAESWLLQRLPFLLLQWSGMNECGAELECENMMPYKSRKTCLSKDIWESR